MNDRAIRIAAAIISNEQGHVLLVRKKGADFLMQAGGKIDPGETPLDALRRELREEIDIDLRDAHPPFLGTFTAPAANEIDAVVEAAIFDVRISEPVFPQAEIEEIVWVDPKSPPDRPIAPLTRMLLGQFRD